MRLKLTTALLAAALALPAHADLMLEYQDEHGAHAFSMFVKGKRMRMETHGEHPSVTLFDADSRELTILDPADRSFTVIDRATMQAMRRQMEQAFEMMRQQGVDPAAMGLDITPQVETRVVETGESRMVDGHRCEVVRYEVNDEVSTLACVVPPSVLGIEDSEWLTISEMFAALADMTTQLLPSGTAAVEMQPSSGIPLEAHDVDGGDMTRLTRVEHAPQQDSLFRVPDGWRRVRIDR